MSNDRKKLTIPDLLASKVAGKRLVMIASGETLTAIWAERAGVDIIGVGDSLGMTLYGHDNTLPISVDQMIQHTQAVRRGAPNTLLLVSMPYGSYATKDMAVTNAVRMMKESGAEAIKLQGGREMFDIIKAVADAGVPVMSHIGLLPHYVHRYGDFKMQGKTAEDALHILDNARAIEEAGAIGLEIEAMPIFVPIIKTLGYDPVWFGILFCMNMQISYLSPPFGPAAFYLKGVAPPEISLQDIYRALWPFMLLQVLAIAIVIAFPDVAMWLPNKLNQ